MIEFCAQIITGFLDLRFLQYFYLIPEEIVH
jgi:hypothetical protein